MPLRNALKALYGIEELPGELRSSNDRQSSSFAGPQNGLARGSGNPAPQPAETDPITQAWSWAQNNQDDLWVLVLAASCIVIGFMLAQFI